jgi:hypothetical protein
MTAHLLTAAHLLSAHLLAADWLVTCHGLGSTQLVLKVREVLCLLRQLHRSLLLPLPLHFLHLGHGSILLLLQLHDLLLLLRTR